MGNHMFSTIWLPIDLRNGMGSKASQHQLSVDSIHQAVLNPAMGEMMMVNDGFVMTDNGKWLMLMVN